MNFSPLIEYVENVLRKEKGVPSCDLKVMRGHETVFRYASGASDYEGKTPVSPKDLYLIYSCTKPMTCAAALQLVEKGIIHLDDPVSKFLPDFAGACSIGEFGWEGAAGAYVLMDPQYDLSIFYVMHVRNWASMIGNGHAVIRDLTYEALGL